MLLSRSHVIVIAIWFTALAALLGVRFLLGTPASVLESIGVLALGVIPATVFAIVFRAAPRSIAQVLYDAEHPSATGGPRARERKSDR